LAVRRQHDRSPEAEGDLSRQDVPEVLGDHVAGKEVYLLGGVGPGGAGGLYPAAVSERGTGDAGLDLHAQEAPIRFHGEVITGGVAPGLGDPEPLFGGAQHEAYLGPFPALLGVADGCSFIHGL